jgi:hypothetical protein
VLLPLIQVHSARLYEVTVIKIADDVDAAKFASPEYTAVMLSVPSGREDVFSVATPLLFRFPLPKDVVPLENVTVPLGVPLDAFTVAVSVSVWPTVRLVAEAVMEVVVAMPATVTRTGGEDCEGASVEEPP